MKVLKMNVLDDSLDIEAKENPCGYDMNDIVASLLDVRKLTSKLGTSAKAGYSKIVFEIRESGVAVNTEMEERT